MAARSFPPPTPISPALRKPMRRTEALTPRLLRAAAPTDAPPPNEAACYACTLWAPRRHRRRPPPAPRRVLPSPLIAPHPTDVADQNSLSPPSPGPLYFRSLMEGLLRCNCRILQAETNESGACADPTDLLFHVAPTRPRSRLCPPLNRAEMSKVTPPRRQSCGDYL